MHVKWLVWCALAIGCQSGGHDSRPSPAVTSGSSAPIPAPPAPLDAPPAPQIALVRCTAARLPPHVDAPRSEPAKPSEADLEKAIGEIGGAGAIGTANGYGQGGGRAQQNVGLGDGMGGRSIGSHGMVSPGVTLGPLSVVGSLDKEIIHRYLRRSEQKLRYCYERRLVQNPGIAGTLIVKFVIDPEGKVPSAVVSGVDPEVADCVRGVLRQIEFPKPTGGGLVEVSTRLTAAPDSGPADHRGEIARYDPPKPTPPVHVADTREWTPYAASEGLAPDDIASAAAAQLAAAIPEHRAKLTACVGARTGSLRVVARVGGDGAIVAVRAGGLGDHQVDACIASELIGMKLAPAPIISEVACDFTMGESQPWRVTDDGYYTIAVTKDGVLHDGKPVTSAPTPKKDEDLTLLVIVDRDAPGKLVDAAVRLTVHGSASLFAVKGEDGALRLAGTGPSGRAGARTSAPAYRIDATADPLRACDATASIATASVHDAKAVDAMVSAIAKACGSGCADAPLAIRSASGADLLAIAGAAQRAGVERITVGGAPCANAKTK
jgi:hypothetical protein